MSDSNRLSFEDASRELGISEEELEKLVADGEIASIKEGDTLYFKKDIVDAYKNRDDEPAVLLSDEEINLLEDDDEVDFGIDLGEEPAEESAEEAGEPAVSAEASGPAAAPSEGETDEISFDDVPEIDLGDSGEKASDPDETVVNLSDSLDDSSSSLEDDSGLLEDTEGGGLGEDTLLDTDVLDLGGEDTDTFDLDTAEETLIDPTEEGTLLRGGGARVMQMKRKQSHGAWTGLLAVGALLLLVPLSVLLSTIYTQNVSGSTLSAEGEAFGWIEKYNFLSGLVKSIASLF